MSARNVALVRGINVGRANRIAMSDLRAMVEELGYSDVRTILNSGNVVFTDPGCSVPDEAGKQIESSLDSQLGVSARVTVLAESELTSIVRDNPLLDVADNLSGLFVAVFARSADQNLIVPLVDRDWSPEVLAMGERVAYLWCPEGVLASSLSKAMGRATGDAITTRNWATIMKIDTFARDQQKQRTGYQESEEQSSDAPFESCPSLPNSPER